MAVNRSKFQQLKHGVGVKAALVLADPAKNGGAAVTNAAALTAPATVNATTYTNTEVQAIRNDVAALQVKLNALLTSLRNAGMIG